MTADRDPVVGALLDRLPVDPPPPGFWDDLRTRLESGDVVELHPHAPSTRWRRRRVVALAAAVVIVAVAAGVGLRDDGAEVEIGPPVTQPTTRPTTPAPSTAQQAVLDAAQRWVHAVADGDDDEAWALLGPQSRASVGSRAAFDELMDSSLPQPWSIWAQSGPDAATALSMGSAAEPRWWIVAFQPVDGEQRVEPPEDDPLRSVLAVRLGADATEVSVEPLLPGPALSLIELPVLGLDNSEGAFPVLDPDVPLAVHVDADVAHFVVAIDGVAAGEQDLLRDEAGAVVGVRLPAGAVARETTHTITVGIVLSDGTIAADSKGFRLR